MVGVVLVTEAQQTERQILFLIIVLLVVAVLLFGLTIWYWRHTSPKRYVRRVFPEPRPHEVDLRQRYEGAAVGGGYDPSREAHGRVLQDAYDPRRDPSPYQQGYDGWAGSQGPYDPRDARPDPYAIPYEGQYEDPYRDPHREARRR